MTTLQRSQNRLSSIISPILKDIPNYEQLVKRIIAELHKNSASLGIRDKIRIAYGDDLKCWLCGLPIYNDEPLNTDASFSIDHVHKKANGGQTTLENCKPAHRLCNSVRHSPYETKVIKKRVRLMKNYLLSRSSKEKKC